MLLVTMVSEKLVSSLYIYLDIMISYIFGSIRVKT